MKVGLQYRNFVVETFSKPLEALSMFEAGKYDLALLDIEMPQMNGFELCRKLLMKDPQLKVCFFTAFENFREQFRKEFPEIRSDCFMKKPMSIVRLANEISKYLGDPMIDDCRAEASPFQEEKTISKRPA